MSYGPVVMRFEEASDTHLEWTYGPRSLWLFDSASDRGAVVLRISTVTGRLVHSVPMPRIFRPLLAANDDGLWLAVATNGGFPGSGRAAPVYHVGPDARAPTLIRRTGRAALWLVAAGHAVWLDAISGTSDRKLWRFDGARGASRLLGRQADLDAGSAALDAGAQTLWLARDVPTSGSFDACRAVRIVTIDGRNGAIAKVVDLRRPTGRCLYAGPANATFAFGAFYLLDNQSQPNRLYRITR